MSQLIETYTSILETVGLTAKDDGSIFNEEGDRYFVKGKPLYLPLPSVLSDPSVADKLIFHPLGEAAAKGESDVVEDIRLRGVTRLIRQTSKLVQFLISLGVGEVKAALDPDQLKVMAVIKDIGEKEGRDIFAVLRATARGEGKKTPIVKIYLSRANGEQGKKKYTRKAVVTFPLYAAAKSALEGTEKAITLLGVSMNRKGVQSLVKIMEYLFPTIKEEGSYNEGGFSQVAPFCDALFRAVGNLTAVLNEKCKLFESVDVSCPPPLSEGWADVVDLIDSLFAEISLIPVQPNADGKARVSDLQQAAMAVQPGSVPNIAPAGQTQAAQVAVPQAPAPQVQQPVYAQPAPQQMPQQMPEYIRDPVTGAIRKNPALMGMVGGGVMMPMVMGQQTGTVDPFASQLQLPNSSGQMSQAQMLTTMPGAVVTTPANAQLPMYPPQGMYPQQPQPMYGQTMYPQQPGMVYQTVQPGYGQPMYPQQPQPMYYGR